MIYVDTAIYPYRGQMYCHMATDGDLAELHAFAARIGMKRSWFQDKPGHPHYDLSPKMRAAAISHGAIDVGPLELIRKCFKNNLRAGLNKEGEE